MSKKKAFTPSIFLGGFNPPGPGGGGGYGSDQSGNDPVGGNAVGPVSYADWAKSLGPDAGSGSFEAYGQWWADNGFSMDAWNEFNPNTSFTWGPENDE